MNEPIVSIDRLRLEVNLAFTRRILPDACPYPDGSDARRLWLQEYKQLHNAYYAVEPAVA